MTPAAAEVVWSALVQGATQAFIEGRITGDDAMEISTLAGRLWTEAKAKS